MTPIESTYMLDENTVLDKHILKEIYSKGYSRLPVYQGHKENIVGILLARDLILLNPEKGLITIKQLSSLLIRDVIQIDHETQLQPILTFFKKGQTHIGVVTKVVEEDGKDPEYRKVGIITLEDILEEILVHHEDDDSEIDELRGERKRLKEKLVLLFSDQKPGKGLNETGIYAVSEYLQKQVKAFSNVRMRREVLLDLIKASEIVEIRTEDFDSDTSSEDSPERKGLRDTITREGPGGLVGNNSK